MNLDKFHNISNTLKSHQKLIAVSKGQDIGKIKHLYDIGHRDFGENFLQELKKKKDMLKLFVMVLLVLLAFCLHDVIKVYLNKYILSKDLTSKEELYLRLAIPLTIYFVIWTIKAFSK